MFNFQEDLYSSSPSGEGDFFEVEAEEVKEEVSQEKSSALVLRENFKFWSAFLFFFCLGSTLAFVSRLLSAWIVYFIVVLLISIFLFFFTPDSRDKYFRRLCGLSLCLSAVSFWDALLQFLVAPVVIGKAILHWGTILGIGVIVIGIILLSVLMLSQE